MIEQDSITGEYSISFPVIASDPVSIKLGYCVRRARIKRRFFILGDLLDFAKKLRGRGLVKASFLLETKDTYGFQKAQCSKSIGIRRILR